MAVSSNGWTAIPSGTDSRLAIIPHVQGRVLKGDVETIFRYIVDFINSEVEVVQYSQSWGYAYRKISGSTNLTNHASGTAIDINAVKHPMGYRNTYSTTNQAKIRKMIASLDGVVRWGGDYRERPDDMHFEINVPTTQSSQVKAVADKIRSGSLGDFSSATEPATSTPSVNKTVNQMAQEVISGIHGSGHDARKKSLGISDSLYAEVRAEVNRLIGTGGSTAAPAAPTKTIAQMADEVIAGKHGSGHADRQKSLGISDSLYEAVRAEINRRVGSGTAPVQNSKSISEMAEEIINGQHGIGHDLRQRSLGVDDATYAKVREEVNRLATSSGIVSSEKAADSYPFSSVLTLQRIQKAARESYLGGTDYDHRRQALASLKAIGYIDRTSPKSGETWVSLFREAWKNWQEALGYSGSDADGIPGAISVYALARRVGLKYWDSKKRESTATVVPLPGAAKEAPADTTDRHIPSRYPYTETLTLQRLQKAANTEVLTGEDYNHRIQALTSLKALGHINRRVPNQGETWVALFIEAWKNWQKSLGYTGSDADGIPGPLSVYKLTVKVGLRYWDNKKKVNKVTGTTPSEDTTDRHIPSTYPYTNTLTLQRLQKAAKTEVLTGEDYNHRLQALTSLKALKHIDRNVPRVGEKWVPLFKEAWKNWQKALGYSGSDADGVPGATSVQKLAKRVGLKYWDSAKNTSSASTSPGLPRTGSSGRVNPTDGGYVTTPFGKRPNNNSYWRAFGRHTGADYARSKCKSASLYAVSSGTVYYRWDKVLGHIAILEADDLKGKSHRYFWYCHLSSKPTTGRVKKGQRIGYIGQSGTGAAGPHLHIELLRTRTKWGSTWSDFRDPTPYLGQY